MKNFTPLKEGALKKVQEVMITGLVITIGSILAFRIVFYPQSLILPFLAIATLAIFIIWKPIIGMAIYLGLYSFIPASGNINTIKIAMLILTILIFAIWAWKKLRDREYGCFSEYKWIYLFFFYLCFSPLLGLVNHFTVLDWARDIAPMLNMLLIPTMIDTFREKKNRWLLYLIFIAICLGLFRDIIFTVPKYGIYIPMGIFLFYTIVLSTYHTSMMFGMGILMLINKAPYKYFWTVLTFASVGFAAVTITRTIWASIFFVIALILIFYSRFRKIAIVITMFIIMTLCWSIFVPGNQFNTYKSYGVSGGYMRTQSERILGIKQKDVSIQNRFDENKEVLAEFAQSPLFGIGFGYIYHFWRHHVSGKGGSGFFESNYTHNDLLNILAKGGIIGIMLFIYMLFDLVRKLNRKRKSTKDKLETVLPALGIIAIFTSLFVGSSTPVYQTREAIFLCAIFIGLGLSDIKVKTNNA